MRILAIQHEPGTGPLRFGDWLTRAGAQLTVLRPDLGEQVPDATNFTQVADALMVLGGAADADDDDHHPWFRPVRKLLTTSAKGAFPSFNICLGGQMLALATGGGIRRRAVAQIGVFALRHVDSIAEVVAPDPVFAGLADGSPAVLFHRDEIVLPPGAVHVLGGTDSPVQAFRVGECAWGVQFHPESTAAQLAEWFSHKDDWGIDEAEVLARVRAVEGDVEAAFAPVAQAFVDYCVRFASPDSATMS